MMQSDQAFLHVGARAHFLVLPSSTRTWPLRTLSNKDCFLASESASPITAISALGMPGQ